MSFGFLKNIPGDAYTLTHRPGPTRAGTPLRSSRRVLKRTPSRITCHPSTRRLHLSIWTHLEGSALKDKFTVFSDYRRSSGASLWEAQDFVEILHELEVREPSLVLEGSKSPLSAASERERLCRMSSSVSLRDSRREMNILSPDDALRWIPRRESLTSRQPTGGEESLESINRQILSSSLDDVANLIYDQFSRVASGTQPALSTAAQTLCSRLLGQIGKQALGPFETADDLAGTTGEISRETFRKLLRAQVDLINGCVRSLLSVTFLMDTIDAPPFPYTSVSPSIAEQIPSLTPYSDTGPLLLPREDAHEDGAVPESQFLALVENWMLQDRAWFRLPVDALYPSLQFATLLENFSNDFRSKPNTVFGGPRSLQGKDLLGECRGHLKVLLSSWSRKSFMEAKQIFQLLEARTRALQDWPYAQFANGSLSKVFSGGQGSMLSNSTPATRLFLQNIVSRDMEAQKGGSSPLQLALLNCSVLRTELANLADYLVTLHQRISHVMSDSRSEPRWAKLNLVSKPLSQTGQASLTITRRVETELHVDKSQPVEEYVRHLKMPSTLLQLMHGLAEIQNPLHLCGSERPLSLILTGERAVDLGGPFLEVTSDAISAFKELYLEPNLNARTEMGYNRDVLDIKRNHTKLFDLHAITWPARLYDEVWDGKEQCILDDFKRDYETVHGDSSKFGRLIVETLEKISQFAKQRLRHQQRFLKDSLPANQLALVDAETFKIFYGTGILLAASSTSGCPIDLNVSPKVWRLIAGETISREDELSTDTNELVEAEQWLEAKAYLSHEKTNSATVEEKHLWEAMTLSFTHKTGEENSMFLSAELSVFLTACFNCLKFRVSDPQVREDLVPGSWIPKVLEKYFLVREREPSWTDTFEILPKDDALDALDKLIDLFLILERQKNSSRNLICFRILVNGFRRVIPRTVTENLVRAKDIEEAACGYPDIDVGILKRNTVVRHGGLDHEVKLIDWLWSIIEEWDQNKRRLFVRFVSGLSRLPPVWMAKSPAKESVDNKWKFEIQISKPSMLATQDDPMVASEQKEIDRRLPAATTCFQILKLPPYSSRRVLKEKLLTAITICSDIDLDDNYMESNESY